MNDITIHSIVKNEPFVYYAIKSVYDEADKILLYDTGSTDGNTLNDIYKLLKEDKKKKIEFNIIPMEDQSKGWTSDNQLIEEVKWKDKRGLGYLRQLQIDFTKTEFFLIVDGDEIHPKGAIAEIKKHVLPRLVDKVCCARIPLIWLCGLDEMFNVKNRDKIETTGRVFRTDKVFSNILGFPEEHFVIENGRRAGKRGTPYCVDVPIKPYFHYEAYLKPWRRSGDLLYSRRKLTYEKPEVMLQYPEFIKRYERGNDNGL